MLKNAGHTGEEGGTCVGALHRGSRQLADATRRAESRIAWAADRKVKKGPGNDHQREKERIRQTGKLTKTTPRTRFGEQDQSLGFTKKNARGLWGEVGNEDARSGFWHTTFSTELMLARPSLKGAWHV